MPEVKGCFGSPAGSARPADGVAVPEAGPSPGQAPRSEPPGAAPEQEQPCGAGTMLAGLAQPGTGCWQSAGGEPKVGIGDLAFPSLCFNTGRWAGSPGLGLGCSGSVFPALSQAVCMMLGRATLHCHISLLTFPKERQRCKRNRQVHEKL